MNTPDNTENCRKYSGGLMVIAAVIAIVTWAPATYAGAIGDAITDGTFNVNLRYRYEFVDVDDNGKRDANASTLRTRLVYKTAKWNDFDITVNMDDVHTIVADNYYDFSNGKTQYQTVADPEGTDLNVAALTYSGIENTQIIVGRQRIIHANARFIGNVGWRQNEQTYDGATIKYGSGPFNASYSYISQVRRIFGPDEAAAKADSWDSQSHLMNASYKVSNALTVSAYGYLLDFENATGASNSTYGIRLTGSPKVNDNVTVLYEAEYATQDDYEDNATNYDADYLRAVVGVKRGKYTVKVGYEVLEADDAVGMAFQTPLATLHGHNGWADKFLGTPGTGLEDIFISASAKVSKGALTLVVHDYSADTGGADYGQEYDFVAKWPINKNVSLMGKFAIYDADSSAPVGGLSQDTTKAWMMVSANF